MQLLRSFYAGLRKSCMQKLRKSRRYWHLRNCCVFAAFAHHDYFYEALRKSCRKAGFSAVRLFHRCQYRRLLRSFSAASELRRSCRKASFFFARAVLWIKIIKTSNILVSFLKFKFLKLISTTMVFLVIVMLNLTTFNGIKQNFLSFQLHFFFWQTHAIRLYNNRALTLKLFEYAEWKNPALCDYVTYEMGKSA